MVSSPFLIGVAMRHDGDVNNHQTKEEETAMQITTIGLDLAKTVFHIVGLNQAGKKVLRKKIKRSHMLAYFANLPVCTVAMEACASAHYWGRELKKSGHTIKLLPPRYVKAYVQGNKNDYNDALAIAEASNRPNMRLVSTKTVAQQDIQALHRLREGVMSHRTRVSNQIRGLLGEYGIIIPKGVSKLRTAVPSILEDTENNLTVLFRQLLHRAYTQLQELDEHIQHYDKAIQAVTREDKAAQQLQSIPGFGPVISSVFASVIGDGKAFKRGRDASAFIGLVPRQHSSGDKPVLLGISKRGNRYLRGLLIHGARSVIKHADKKEDRLSRWATELVARRGKNKATVALANKMARIGWAILSSGRSYEVKMV